MKVRFHQMIGCLIAAVSTLAVSPSLHAQAWPNKPIRFIVPYPPGGGVDAFGRPLAVKLSISLGQQVVVENRGGAGGTIGADLVAKAAPDGYTFLVGAVHHALAPAVYKQLSYDLAKDLAPVTGVAYVPDILVVSSRVAAKSLADLVADSKARPGGLSYGTSGNGTTRHLAGALFSNLTGSKLLHVPYKGSGPAMLGLMAGETDLMFVDMSSAAGPLRGGKIRAMAVTTKKRSPTFPEVPTMAEAGISGFEMQSWYGLWAPAGTPPEIVARMQSEVAKALALPDIKALWFSQGAEPGGESTAEFTAHVNEEIKRWAKAAKDNNITID